jgi:acyl-coenzyme A thioesterase PaaI-like protein
MPDPVFATSPADLPDRDTLLSLSGLDFMQRVVDGTLPQAPIARLMNFHLAQVSHGHAIFHGAPLFDHMNPMGGIHGGWYGTLLDSCMGCAVMTSLPQGRAYTTLEYKVNLVRAIPEGTAPSSPPAPSPMRAAPPPWRAVRSATRKPTASTRPAPRPASSWVVIDPITPRELTWVTISAKPEPS